MQRFGSPIPQSPAEAARRKKRRYQSRSDEEIEAEMDNRGLNYRHGWPLLPPLPVQTFTQGATLAVQNAEQHLISVQNILAAQRIQTYDVYFAYRVPNDATQNEPNEAFLTLVVTVNTSMPVSFVAPVIRLRQYLKSQEETAELYIEMIDYRAIDGLFTFAISPKDTAILEKWDQVSSIVESEISNFREKWLSIELLHRGLMEHRCSPTFIITSPTAGDATWMQTIVPAIRQKIRNLQPLFDVEVMCATTLVGARKSDTLSVKSYAKTVVMGSSIGISNDEKHAGTVGGFVNLSNGKTYGLTNHHVVRDDVVDEGKSCHKHDCEVADISAVIKATETNMLKPRQMSKTLRFKSPADCDHAEFLEQLKEQERTWQKQKDKGNARAAPELTSLQDQKSEATQSSREFGTLFASSGPRLMERQEFLSRPGGAQPKGKAASATVNFLLDWALLEVMPSRSLKNELPNTGLRLNGTTTHLVEGQLCKTWTPLDSSKTHIKRDEVEVGKHGRTTGFTFGTINCALTKINPDIDSTWENVGQVYRPGNSTVGSCYSIIKRGKTNFVDAGDSGSIVVHDDTGTWLGLLFGECFRLRTDASHGPGVEGHRKRHWPGCH